MGAADKIWNATEVAESHSSDIPSSSLTVDHALSLPDMKPRIVCAFSLSFRVSVVYYSFAKLAKFTDFQLVRCKQCALYLQWFKPPAPFSGDGSAFMIANTQLCLCNLEKSAKLYKIYLFNYASHFDKACTMLFGSKRLYVALCLLKVSVRENAESVVNMTVRLYGPNTEYVINRERELQAIPHLSDAGFGAKLLGVFGNGMVQSFINARTLTPSDMRKPKLMAEIAKQLRKFHEVEIPGSKEPQLWNDIFKFLDRASRLKFDDGEKQKKYEKYSFGEINEELTDLKVITDRFGAPVVYCHNDLLSGNLMLNDDEDKLYFIDFEYGSYNYRGFDIGNHFNEYAGYDCDYSLYPSKDEQYHFFRHYLRPDRPHEVTDKELEALYAETNSYMLASHLYWALWALIQAKMSPIDFDYLGYFFLRYNEYKKQKDECLLLAQSYLSMPQAG
ncbi:UNVERIFIED_CONTAM: putative ethanolamine kinase [Sesamum angustifolium]|uniref:ethanolamine kinase n=1 Tax=Sesamum angustifolium TaxID=2727405 RepID=A0AAW2PT82_9LAMI